MDTTSIVDEELELVDGSETDDVAVKKRWRRAVQRAANLIWNDRPWAFKLKTNTAFAYDPLIENVMPDDFGSVESKGAGVYCPSPMSWLRPIDIGELNILRNGTPIQLQGLGPWTQYSIGPGATAPYILELWRQLPAPATLGIVYLRRSPKCVYSGVDSGTDELFWIPDQWSELVKAAAEYFATVQINSNQEDATQAILKLGLDQMRAREQWGSQGKMGVVPFMRNRMNR